MNKTVLILMGVLVLALPANAEEQKYSTLFERIRARRAAAAASYGYGCGGGGASMMMSARSYGCNGGTQMYLTTGNGCNGGAMPIQGGGCCGGGGGMQQTYYMLPPQPVQVAAPCAPAPTQIVQTSAPVQAPPAQTGASVNVQYYLPPPQIQGTTTQMNPPIQQQECAPGTYSGKPGSKRQQKTAYVRQEWRPMTRR